MFNPHSPLGKDLARYRKNGHLQWAEPSLWVIIWYRFGQWGRERKNALVRRLITAIHLPGFAMLTLLTGIHLPRGARIGGGLKIWHFGGIVLNPDTVIGANCTLRHGVTIGNHQTDHDVPVIGDNVEIGAGAKVLGAIRIGHNVSIGANAVVLCDVPDDYVAVGVPARSRPRKNTSTPTTPKATERQYPS